MLYDWKPDCCKWDVFVNSKFFFCDLRFWVSFLEVLYCEDGLIIVVMEFRLGNVPMLVAWLRDDWEEVIGMNA